MAGTDQTSLEPVVVDDAPLRRPVVAGQSRFERRQRRQEVSGHRQDLQGPDVKAEEDHQSENRSEAEGTKSFGQPSTERSVFSETVDAVRLALQNLFCTTYSQTAFLFLQQMALLGFLPYTFCCSVIQTLVSRVTPERDL